MIALIDLFSAAAAVKAFIVGLAAFAVLLLRRAMKKDKDEVQDTINRGRQAAASDDDAALNDELTAARDRMRDPKNRGN